MTCCHPSSSLTWSAMAIGRFDLAHYDANRGVRIKHPARVCHVQQSCHRAPERLMTVGDLDGGFVTAPSSGVGTVLPKTIATVVSVTNPTSAIDRTIVRNVANARWIVFDVLT